MKAASNKRRENLYMWLYIHTKYARYIYIYISNTAFTKKVKHICHLCVGRAFVYNRKSSDLKLRKELENSIDVRISFTDGEPLFIYTI